MNTVFLIPVAIGALFLLPSVMIWIKDRRGPSIFVVGICKSLREKPSLWNYNDTETWIMSDDAALEISLQSSNFGRCNSRIRSNVGSLLIQQFASTDLRAFRKAYEGWKTSTAIERQHTIERRKRDALAVLTA